jgi:hypothetical protein
MRTGLMHRHYHNCDLKAVSSLRDALSLRRVFFPL